MKKTFLMMVVSFVLSFLILQIISPVIVMGEAVTGPDVNTGAVTGPGSNTGAVTGPGSNTGAVTGTADNSGVGTVGTGVMDGPGTDPNYGLGTGATGKIENPLKNGIDTIPKLIGEILKFVVNLLSIAGALYIMWTGFLFVKAQGNPEELKVAKSSFVNAIIGMAIILGAWGLAQVISSTINKVTGTDTGLGLNG